MFSSRVIFYNESNFDLDMTNVKPSNALEFLKVRNSKFIINKPVTRCYFSECTNLQIEIETAPAVGIYFEKCHIIELTIPTCDKSMTIDVTKCRNFEIHCTEKLPGVKLRVDEFDNKDLTINEQLISNYEYSTWAL